MFALAAVKCIEMCKAILVVGGVFWAKNLHFCDVSLFVSFGHIFDLRDKGLIISGLFLFAGKGLVCTYPLKNACCKKRVQACY